MPPDFLEQNGEIKMYQVFITALDTEKVQQYTVSSTDLFLHVEGIECPEF